MPEGEKDDRLDGEELESWIIGSQELLGGRVEEEEGEEGDRDADVVDQGGVEVALGNLPSALVVFAPSLRKDFYRTRVLSLVMLVSDSLTHSLTDSCLVNLMALYDPNYLMMSQQLLNVWEFFSLTH